MTHYSATSLEQIADELERLAGEAERSISTFGPDAWKREKQARAEALREAATLVRNTRLADPAMDAMVKALQFIADVARTTPNFSPMALKQADTALKLAKDNGHV